MTYSSVAEMKKAHKAMIDAFPMHFAFGQKQLDEELAKMGVGVDDVVSIGAGGFILKSDVKAYVEMFKVIRQEEDEFKKEEKNLVNLICSELRDHEYGYTCDLEESLAAAGVWEEYCGGNEFVVNAVKKAVKKFKKGVRV